jgi:ATP-dependent 26S proteasome regulatory subunit
MHAYLLSLDKEWQENILEPEMKGLFNKSLEVQAFTALYTFICKLRHATSNDKKTLSTRLAQIKKCIQSINRIHIAFIDAVSVMSLDHSSLLKSAIQSVEWSNSKVESILMISIPRQTNVVEYDPSIETPLINLAQSIAIKQDVADKLAHACDSVANVMELNNRSTSNYEDSDDNDSE